MAAEERIDSIIVQEAIEQERKYMLGVFGELEGKISAFSKVRIKLEGADTFKGLVDGQKALNKELTETDKIEKQLAATTAKLNALETENMKLLIAEREALRQRTAEEKNYIREVNSAEGSLEKRRATLIRLQKEYDRLGEAERSSEKGIGLRDQIKGLSDGLKADEGATGRFQRNVGNYSSATVILRKALDDVNKKLKENAKESKLSAEAVQFLTKEQKILEQFLERQEAAFSSVNQEIKENTKQLQLMAIAGLEGTEAYNLLFAETSRLKDETADLKTALNNADPDDVAFEAAAQAARGLIGVYGLAKSAAAIFGFENEALEQTLVKLQAAETALQSIEAIRVALKKESALRQAILLVQQKIAIAQTNLQAAAESRNIAVKYSAIAAQRALNAVMSAAGGPMLAILGVLALLFVSMSSFGNSTKSTAEKLKLLNEEQAKQIELTERYLEIVKRNVGVETRNLEVQIAKAKALGKSEEEILKLEGELLKQRQLAAQAEFNYTRGEAGFAELETAADNARIALEEFRKAPKDADGDAIKKTSDEYKTQLELLEQTFDAAEKAALKQKAINQEFYDANRDAALKQIELEETIRKKREKIQQEESRAKLERLKITSTAAADKEEEESELIINSITKRINARVKQFSLEKEIITRQRDFSIKELQKKMQDEFLSEADVAERKRLINVKYADERRRLEEKVSLDIITIRQNELARQRELLKKDLELFEPEDKVSKLVEREEKAFERRSSFIKENNDVLIARLEKEKNAKLKAADGEKERQEIEEKYQRKRLEVELETDRLILKAAFDLAQSKLKLITDPTTRAALEAELANIKLKLQELNGVEIKLDTDQAIDDLGKLKEGIQEVLGAVISSFGAVADIFGGSIDRQKNALQDQIDLIEERKEKEIAAVEATALSERDKADKINRINILAAAQKESLERKQRQLDLQRAKFERFKNIAQIVQTTAVAVIDGLIKGGPGLAAVYGAIGALQLAAAIAQPLPRFEKGTLSSPAGLALTDEKGPELYIEPSGKTYLGNDRPTLRNLVAGTRIYKADHDFTKAARWGALERLPAGSDVALELARSGGADRYLMRRQLEVSEQLIIENQEMKRILKNLKLSVHNTNEVNIAWYQDKQQQIFG
jgi:hypothetical protein